MLYINNSDTPYSEQRVTLGSTTYTVVIKFNSRNKGWYLSLKDSSGQETIIDGVKLEPNQIVTNRYILEGFSGAIGCLRVKNDFTELNRYNLGRERAYRIVWFSEDELVGTGVGSDVQLS